MHVFRTCTSHHLLLLAAIASDLVTSSPVPSVDASSTTSLSSLSRPVDPFWSRRTQNANLVSRFTKRDDPDDDEQPLSTDDEDQNEPDQGSNPGEDADDEVITPGSQATLSGASSSKALASSAGVAAAASGGGLASAPRFIPPASNLKASRQEYKDAGITVLVSLFGWFAKPTSSNWDPATTANMMAAWVKANGVDGIDVDYEDTAAMAAGKAEAWVITLTTAAQKPTRSRLHLDSRTYVGFTACLAMAPWWGPASGDFPNGGYRKIDQSVGSMIDWLLTLFQLDVHLVACPQQFYNSGTKYEDCTSLVQQAPDQTAALQINSEAKVPLNKIVIGKPLSPADGGTYTDMPTLSSCLQTAKAAGWDAGISFWKYADNATEAMTEARNPRIRSLAVTRLQRRYEKAPYLRRSC
ncbi:hypothetical protein B0H13DRAFT_2457347 [Mycena leptocephala]|nr:hypothetical protein B0H13DRAFT_2457347 [Mycena leptocephala]